MAINSQLIKKNKTSGGYNKVFPKTFIDSIKDRETGLSLNDILSNFNMYFLSYVGSREDTRLQVPSFLRKRGLFITYVNFSGDFYSEYYNSDDISDTAFGKDNNWIDNTNKFIGDLSISSSGHWVINGIDTGIPATAEIDLEQSTGDRVETTMSQKAITDALNNLDKDLQAQITELQNTTFPLDEKIDDVKELLDSKVIEAGGVPFDITPTEDSTNPVTSDGIYKSQLKLKDALDNTLNNTGIGDYPTFSNSTAYSAGDVVNYQGKLYQFTTSHAAGAWLGTDVKETDAIKAHIVQEFGDDENAVISQKTTTEKFTELESNIYYTDNQTLNQAIYSIQIFNCKYEKDKYAISIRKGSENTNYNIYLTFDDNVVAQYYVSYKNFVESKIYTLSPKDEKQIYGYIVLNWDKFESGTAVRGNLTNFSFNTYTSLSLSHEFDLQSIKSRTQIINKIVFVEDDYLDSIIKEFYIDISNSNKKYNSYALTIDINNTRYSFYILGETSEGSYVNVCQYYSTRAAFKEQDIYRLDEHSESGIKGYIIIDLSKITDLKKSSINVSNNAFYVKNSPFIENSFYNSLNKINKNSVSKYGIKDNGFIINNYVPNPCFGLVEKGVYINPMDTDFYDINTTGIIRLTLRTCFSDDCFGKDGMINRDVLKGIVTQEIEKIIKEKKRWILRLGNCWMQFEDDAYMTLVDTNLTSDGKAYIAFPIALYNYLKDKENSFYIYPSWTDGQETQNVLLLNFKNDYNIKLMDTWLSVVAEVLNEDTPVQQLDSDNNTDIEVCKKGDYVAFINIQFINKYGEGLLVSYEDKVGIYDDSDSLIKVVELYKKHFYNYVLVAPLGAMSKGYSNGLNDFQYYLMTTTYGNNFETDGSYTGDKEFGLFTGHIFSISEKTFNVEYNNAPLNSYAVRKYLKAPIYGEDINGYDLSVAGIYTFYNVILKYHPSLIRLVDNFSVLHPASCDNALKLVNKIGCKMIILNRELEKENNHIKGKLGFVNIGTSPCYYDFWKIQIVVRDGQTNEVIKVVDLDYSLKEISSIVSMNEYVETSDIYKVDIDIDVSDMSSEFYNLFVRIIDIKKVNENFYLSIKGRRKEGEYCIYCNKPNWVTFYDSENYKNHPQNTSYRYLYTDYVLKDAYKEGYKFEGWFEDLEFTKPIKVIPVDRISGITVYPKFVE